MSIMQNTMAKYENDILLLCETLHYFMYALFRSKTAFHLSGPFRLIKTMLKPHCFCKVYLQYGSVIQRVVTRQKLLKTLNDRV